MILSLFFVDKSMIGGGGDLNMDIFVRNTAICEIVELPTLCLRGKTLGKVTLSLRGS